MPLVFLGVGSNLGDREARLDEAAERLTATPGIGHLRFSPVYETDPVDASGGKFLNAVWSFETRMRPREVLAVLQTLEVKAGRVRKARNEPRPLDLDLLTYGDAIIREDGLIVPHPRMHERYFVLKPFCDLAPGWIHPELGQTARDLLLKVEGTD